MEKYKIIAELDTLEAAKEEVYDEWAHCTDCLQMYPENQLIERSEEELRKRLAEIKNRIHELENILRSK